MKNRFTTLDVIAAVHDLQKFVGLRVSNIYDVNSKTYLIKLQRPEKKAVIMFESGIHIHSSDHDWGKSQFPSSFSMKMRKHIKQRRLHEVKQLGIDRIVDLSFGEGDLEVHVIVELYDRGNVLLTDHEYVILNILRPRTDKDTDVKYSVRNRYPVEQARQDATLPSDSELQTVVSKAAGNVQARRLLAPIVQFGNSLIEHALLSAGHSKDVNMAKLAESEEGGIRKLQEIISSGQAVFKRMLAENCCGFITFKTDTNHAGETIESYVDYHPYRFAQCDKDSTKEFESFSDAVDEFLSKMTIQKIEQKALNVEREAMKMLENVKKDHDGRIVALDECQEKLKLIAERVIANKELVERALVVIRSALANQLSWDRIGEMCREAAKAGDPVASSIVELRLENNEVVMRLADPYEEDEDPIDVPINVSLSAFQNSRKIFEDKKAAAEKREKTAASSAKAMKSAQAKAKATLDSVRVRTELTKMRKQMWFEKFLWFISRDGLVVLAGRDAQQNELLVKRYLRSGDAYVHADVRGAASVIIRNRAGSSEDIPPKTLSDAAQMAVCYCNAWEAKVVASAWWVHKYQVSRTAPTGEYLTAGSFMIRGKKNFMPASQLVMGLGIAFKLDDESVERRAAEMKEKIKEEGEGENREESANEVHEDEEEEEVIGEESEEEKDQEEFPDVIVGVQKMRTAGTTNEEYTIINIGPTKTVPTFAERQAKEREKKEREERENLEKEMQKAEMANRPQPLNKRQKHKMEKIKKKYGDQDDEEREMRMRLLGSSKISNTPSPAAAEENSVKNEPVRAEKKEENRPVRVKETQPKEEDEELEEADKQEMAEEDKLLQQLTGSPVPEDTLLYAVPVVAPYSALASYKYKVKLTPGAGKRGKAAKSALELFLRSKQTTPREEPLLRALLTDDGLSRNLPAKVRVSAPHLHKK